MHILIKNGRLIDPSQGINRVADLRLADGKVVAPNDGSEKSEIVIDADGLIVAPGLIDMHVHLREPGNEEAETIDTGSAAALAGGFTTILTMPNTDPCIDNEAAVEFVLRQARQAQNCFVFPVGAITKGRKGEELAEMGQMLRSGAVAFSDDGACIASSAVMRLAMQYAKMLDKPLLQHCEDSTLSGGAMHAGVVSTRLGMPGIPALAEELILHRDIALTADTGAAYHAQHLSSAASVELIRQAKARNLPVTCEVATHHLALTDESVQTSGFDSNYKMNPPLRTARDIAALRAALADGVIDCLVTDHAPHVASEKELEFSRAPFGVIGLETALAINIAELILPGILTWPQLIAAMSTHPARILKLTNKGTLRPGADADVTLIDPDRRWRIDAEQFRSRSRNTPFNHRDVTGKALGAIVSAQLRYDDGLKIG